MAIEGVHLPLLKVVVHVEIVGLIQTCEVRARELRRMKAPHCKVVDLVQPKSKPHFQVYLDFWLHSSGQRQFSDSNYPQVGIHKQPNFTFKRVGNQPYFPIYLNF